MKEIKENFLRGLGTQSLALVFLSLAFVLCFLLFLEWCLSTGAYTDFVPMERVLTSRNDDITRLTYTAHRIGRKPTAVRKVYLLGGSSFREAVGDNKLFSRDLGRSLGEPIEVYNLSGWNQTFGGSMAITDQLPAKGHVFLIGVSASRFSWPETYYDLDVTGERNLLLSPTLLNFLRSEGRSIKYAEYLLPRLRVFAGRFFNAHKRKLKKGRWPKESFRQYRYSEKNRFSNEKKEDLRISDKSKRFQDWFATNFSFNQRGLESLIASLKRRGANVVLVELPLNPLVHMDYLERKGLYGTYLRRIEEKYSVPYLDFSWDLPLMSSDFRDFSHLISSGRSVYQEALTEQILSNVVL